MARDGSGEPDWGRQYIAAPGEGALPREVERKNDWKMWGSTQALQLTFINNDPQTVQVDQLVYALFHHPAAWILGFYIAQNGPRDTSVFTPLITYGLGLGRFQHAPTVVGLSPSLPNPAIGFIGPAPAEMILVEGSLLVQPSGVFPGPTFPRETTITVGAFVAPQVFQ